MSYVGTRALLGNAGNFTSDAKMTNRDDTLVGAVFSDQSGTLVVEQGYPDDGANPGNAVTVWSSKTTIAVTGGTPATISVQLVCPKWRLNYTNGATPQTTFRLDAKATSAGDS